MARRKASRRTKKVPPTERTILAPMNGTNVYIADVGALLSQINRKTFRQGYQYGIESIKIISYTEGVTNVTVGRLPHHWPCVNAWTKGMALWKQQQDDRLEQSGLTQTIAAHRDFKVYMDAAHADGTYLNLQPITTSGTGSGRYLTTSQGQAISASVSKDWEHSEVVLPNKGAPGTTVEYKLHMLGDDNTGGAVASVGLIHAYAESRNRPMQTDPNIVDVPSGGLFGEMFDVADDTGDIVTNAQEKNDKLPYLNDIDTAFEFYPGGANTGAAATLVDSLQIINTGNRTLSSSTIAPFLANCGLISIFADNPCSVLITVAGGPYKGTWGIPMQDVN